MEGEKKEEKEYEDGEEEIKQEDQVRSWVQSRGIDIRSSLFIHEEASMQSSIEVVREEPQIQIKEPIENQEQVIDLFRPKSAQEIRNRYIKKLYEMGIMKDGPKKKIQHLFIFDWDDTLLCTSYLSKINFAELSPQMKQILVELDTIVNNLLNIVIKKCHDVFIITNAYEGWVQYSSKLYLPKTYSILKEKTITIISARQIYSIQYPSNYLQWKILAFKSLLTEKIDRELLTNMICMGDSNFEIEAAQLLGKEFDEAVVKTIKLKEKPKPEQMVKQITTVIEKLDQIFQNPKSLTAHLSRKK